MANPTWNDTGDNWDTAADWSTGIVPGAGDNVTVAQGDPLITSNVGTVASVGDTATIDLVNGGSLTTTAAFANSGTLNLDTRNFGDGGSSLTIEGTLTNGTLNTGGTVNIGNTGLSAATTISAAGFANAQTGTINIAGNTSTLAELAITGAAGFGQGAGVLSGQVNLTNDAVVQFGSGQITSITANSQLYLNGASAQVNDAGVAGNSALVGLATNAGTFDLSNGASVTTTGGLTNSGTTNLDNTNFGNGGSSLTLGGKLTNDGTFNIGNTGLSAPTTVTTTGLTNFVNTTAGTINLNGNTTTLAELDVTAAAGFGTAGILSGTVNLTNDSMIQFASGQITGITANSQLYLNSASAQVNDAGVAGNSALVGLATNAGTFDLSNGASVTTTGGLTNSGTTNLDNTNFGNGGSSLTLGGKLTNDGTFNIGNTGLSAPTTVTATGLTNFVNTTAGTININGGTTNLAELNVGGAASFGRPGGLLVGTVNLTNDALLQFGSGEVTSITAGSQLYLDGPNAYVADAGATTSNSALTGLTGNAGTFDIRNGVSVTTTAAFNNSGTTNLDDNGYGDGGSSLTLGGALTNGGTFDIGNTGLSAPTTVTTTALANTGTINLAGSTINPQTLTANLAELNVTGGAAGFGTAGEVTGTVNLTNDSLVQFAGGQITTITAGSQLYLDGPDAYVADASAPNSNSALTGLTTNAGTFDLRDGAAVTTTGPLTNSGTTNVDDNGYGDGGSSLAIGGALTNSNTINIGNTGLSATTTVTAASLDNTGTINVTGSPISSQTGLANMASFTVNGAATGTGTIALGTSANVELGGAASNNVSFGGTNDLVLLDVPAAGFTGNITGFASGDTLDLAGENVTIQSYDGTTLTVMTAAGATQSYALAGPMANGLEAISDGNGGTDIVICFASGTAIRTMRGDVPVEELQPGDEAVTVSGAIRLIAWIGHRVIDCARHPRPSEVWPVRVRAGAFGADLPERDLYLSPGHPVLVDDGNDEVLVPIMCLINGTSIARAPVPSVTYWHIELDEHDILLAEGLPAESFLDWGNRPWFEGGADHALANPDFIAPGLDGRCRPVAIDGPVVEAERRRLDALFEMGLSAAGRWPDASWHSFQFDAS